MNIPKVMTLIGITAALGIASLTHLPSQLTTATAQSPTTYLYYSSLSSGTVSGIQFKDEDVLRYNTQTQTWEMFLDLSDVSITNNLDAFSTKYNEANTYLMSFEGATTIPGLGTVQGNDIVKFVATTTGTTTAGTFSLFIDGSDIGLNTSTEDIDAISYVSDGNNIESTFVSTQGGVTAGSFTAGNEDVFAINATSVGDTTVATFRMVLDGSETEHGDENIDALQFIRNLVTFDDIFLFSSTTDFQTGSVSGGSDDIFSYSTNSDSYALTIDASTIGFGDENVDAFALTIE